MNRGTKNDKAPKKATLLTADINKPHEVKSVLDGHFFDSIVQWIAFTEDNVKRDYDYFKDYTNQYVFISSASAYQKPLPYLPITEEMPLDNQYWEYSQNKKKCEEFLLSVHSDDFNVTIIRPSHTYDDTKLISQFKSNAHPYTMLNRMLKNKPIIMPDQGMQLWTLTYNEDFAHGFIDILGNPNTYGEYYHLTSNKVYTWERINEFICEAVGVKPNIIYIPTEFILKHFPEFEGEIYGDKWKSATFNNSKIKSVSKHYRSITDYDNIAKKAVKRLLDNKELQTIDVEFDERYDAVIEAYKQNNK